MWNNIPAFTTRVIKGGKSIYVEKAIVGQVKYATPIFSADMRSIVFNPDWTVPETIKIEDLQPRLRQTKGGVPDVSVLRENKLSVSYQGRPVDAETVDWQRANILNTPSPRSRVPTMCWARSSSISPTATPSTCTTRCSPSCSRRPCAP